MISIVDDLILFNYIDSGCFAEIYLSKKQDSNILLATKKISLKYISVEPLFKTHLENEINFLKGFDHPNIIKLYDVKVTQQDIYLIMEYCNGGSLKKVLSNYQLKYGKPFSQEIVQHLMRQVISGLKYIHDKNLLHGDIKYIASRIEYIYNKKENQKIRLGVFGKPSDWLIASIVNYEDVKKKFNEVFLTYVKVTML